MRIGHVLNAALAVPCVTALAVCKDAAPPGPPTPPGPHGPPAWSAGRGPHPHPAPPAGHHPAPPVEPAASAHTSVGAHAVRLNEGIVQGFADDSGNSVFLGIPFAETTGGQNRYVDSISGNGHNGSLAASFA